MVVALVGSVLVGAVLQRTAGVGFAMVVAPFAIILLPGGQGVIFANIMGAVAATILIWPVRKSIDWYRLVLLVVSSGVGAVAGALIVRGLDTAVFRIVVGLLLLLSIGVSLLAARARRVAAVTPASLVGGAATGMLVTMAGVGGPPMSIYAVMTNWEQHKFVGTMQPFAVVSSLIGATAVLSTSQNALPEISLSVWLVLILTLLVGLALGQFLNRMISARIGRNVVVWLGALGALSAVVYGAIALVVER